MLNINDLSFGYTAKTVLFKNLNLDLKDGHIYGLLGKNGAGKTTLLRNMTGLAFPTKGSCLFNGMNVSRRSVQVLEEIFFIAEEVFVPAITPVQFVASTASFYPKFNETDFYHYLELLDVDEAGVMTKQSYGQQKKVMIAFGLASNTSLLVMDEPTNGLDIPSKVQFRKLIASVQTETRCIIISTHQVRDLDSLIDTLLILHEKEIVVNKTLDEVGEKLQFGTFADTSEMTVLYEEESVRGKNSILENNRGEFSKVDLETFFNAVTKGNKVILEILNAS